MPRPTLSDLIDQALASDQAAARISAAALACGQALMLADRIVVLYRGRVMGHCAAEPPHFDSALSAFRYEAPIAQAIAGLKYHAQFRQSRWLGGEIAALVSARDLPLPDLLVPVPLHPSRLRERGYNQALELARGIHRVLPIAIDWQSATRVRATADQIGKRAKERRREVRGAFTVGPGVAGRHLAIIDDVMTTGSTVNELARACRAAGATRIEVWTAARVP